MLQKPIHLAASPHLTLAMNWLNMECVWSGVKWYEGEQVHPEVDGNAEENSEDDDEDAMDENETDDE